MLVGFLSGSKNSIVPFSTVISTGRFENFGSGSSWAGAPGAVGPPRGVNHRPADRARALNFGSPCINSGRLVWQNSTISSK